MAGSEQPGPFLVYRVETPESATFEFELAGLGTRFAAWAVDFCIVLFISLVGLAVSACFLPFLGAGPVMFALVFGFAAFELYPIVMEFRDGATIGKRIVGIHVISHDGLPIDLGQAVIRNLVRAVDFLTPLYLFGGTVSLMNRHHRRLGDLAAGTVVVRKRRSVRPSEILPPNERYNTLLEDPMLGTRLRRGLKASERDLLVSLCLRRNQLELDRRIELFRDAAAILREKFDLADDRSLSDERLVLNVTAVLLGGGKGGLLEGGAGPRKGRHL